MDYSTELSSTDLPHQSNIDPVSLGAQSQLAGPLTHAIEYTAFLNLMLATIDLDELCENYFQYLASRLPLKGLNFAIQDRLFRIGTPENGRIKVRLPCGKRTREHQPEVSHIDYQFMRTMSVREQQLLHELHTHFCTPLGHAVAYRHLLDQATRDPLTGLGNRAGFDQQVQRSFSQMERHQIPFGLLIIDLDNFKQVNDNFGHQQGDKALVAVADLLRDSLRDDDLAYRFGGDEFCCVLNAVDQQQMLIVAERIRRAFTQSSLLAKHKVTASVGGTIAMPREPHAMLFERADKAVYQVKAKNKNAVLIA